MADLSELQQYLSKYTGAEIDAAVLMVLANYVGSFNGRTGPEVLPEAKDYDLSQIAVNDLLLSSLGKKMDSLLEVLTDIRNNLTKYETTILWQSATTGLAAVGSVFDLSDDALNYDELHFHYYHSNNAGQDCDYLTVDKETLAKTLGSTSTSQPLVYLWQYSSYFNRIGLASAKQIKIFETGNASYTFIYKIVGVNFNKKVFE